MLQIAPNFLEEACSRTPLGNDQLHHVANRLAEGNSPSSPKNVRPPLANPTYAHGLLRVLRRAGRQLIVCSAL